MPSQASHTDLAALVAVVARSQIIVPTPAIRRRLPAGFDEVDAAILVWIAAESRRIARNFPLM